MLFIRRKFWNSSISYVRTWLFKAVFFPSCIYLPSIDFLQLTVCIHLQSADKTFLTEINDISSSTNPFCAILRAAFQKKTNIECKNYANFDKDLMSIRGRRGKEKRKLLISSTIWKERKFFE